MLNLNTVNTRPVLGFEGKYVVSDTGVVVSLRSGKQMSANPSTTVPYLYVKLWKHNVMYNKAVHRLVAESFVPNPDNKPMVNHKDGDKLNNSASNLEWVTCSENHRHAFATGLRQPMKTQLNCKTAGSASEYHGVTFDAARGKWKASIKHNGKNVVQKRFATEREAALYVNKMFDELGLHDRERNDVE